MSDDLIRYASDGRVATITLNRPDRINALSPALLAALVAATERARADGVRAVLLAGEGRGFCSGADLAAGLPEDLGALLRDHYEPAIRAIRDLPVPVVAAVQGAAAGAGCALALAADLVVAGEGAYFLLAFANIGLVPDAGATWSVAKAVGRARAMEMALLGERIAARQALEWGLINRVVPDEELLTAAQALAGRLADAPTVTLGMIRGAVNAALDLSYSDILELEAANQAAAGRTADFREAVTAFGEKRAPIFKGE